MGLGRGLALWWEGDVSIDIRFRSRNFIDSSVSLEGINKACHITWVYACNDFHERMKNWRKLRDFAYRNSVA